MSRVQLAWTLGLTSAGMLAIAFALLIVSQPTGAATVMPKVFHPTVYIDRGTGCHYLASGVNATITPRLGPNGAQVCVPGDKYKQ